MALGALVLSVDAFTEGVVALGAAVELQMSLGFLFFWSTEARREILILSPKTSRATSSGRMMLKLRWARSRISSRQKAIAVGLSVEAWGPLTIASFMVARDQGAPTSARQPSVAYSWSSAVAG